MLALSEPLVLIPDPLADGLLAMPANPMDLGSGSSVSKKDAKLGFVVNYTNLLLIPGSLNNVMEEPAVELPLLDEPGIRTSIGRLDISGLYSWSR